MGEISDALRRATRERPRPPARVAPREPAREEEPETPVEDEAARVAAEDARETGDASRVERVASPADASPVAGAPRDEDAPENEGAQVIAAIRRSAAEAEARAAAAPAEPSPVRAVEAGPESGPASDAPAPRRPRRLSRPVASPTRAPEPEPELETDAVCELANESGEPSAARISLLDPTDPGAVAARQLAQQVKRQADQRDMHSIVVTSPLSGDGKTTVSCNLAVALSRLDRSRSVALLELDLRRPTMARDFGLELDAGVDDALEGRVSIDEAVRRTDVPGLDIVPVRRPREAPEALLASLQLRELIHTLERRYSLLIVDTPPVLAVADTAAVLEVVDGCILVARAGSCPSKSIQRAMEYIPSDKGLGCCLNYSKPNRVSVDYDTYTSHPGLEAERAAAEVRG